MAIQGNKWETLKSLVVQRHDFLEAMYQKTTLPADAAELGAYRTVFNLMNDLERQELRQAMKQGKPQPVQRPPVARPLARK